MPTRLRRFFPAVLASLGAALVGASFAWACTMQAHIVLEPPAGPVGSTMTVKGYSFAENQPVKISWDGQFLAETTAAPKADEAYGDYVWPSFSEPVTVPRAAEGVHTLVAEVYDPASKQTYRPAATFTIRSDQPARHRPAPEPAGGRRQRPRGNQAFRRQSSTPSRVTRSAAPGGQRPRSVAAGDSRPGATNVGGRQVFAGSVAPPGVGTPSPAGSPAGRAGGSPQGAAALPAGSAPSERSATGDLWSGFGAGRPASLTSSATDPVLPADRPGWQLPVGLGVLGFGLMALFASFAVAESRRRRALR